MGSENLFKVQIKKEDDEWKEVSFHNDGYAAEGTEWHTEEEWTNRFDSMVDAEVAVKEAWGQSAERTREWRIV
jgi:hypothetical protein